MSAELGTRAAPAGVTSPTSSRKHQTADRHGPPRTLRIAQPPERDIAEMGVPVCRLAGCPRLRPAAWPRWIRHQNRPAGGRPRCRRGPENSASPSPRGPSCVRAPDPDPRRTDGPAPRSRGPNGALAGLPVPLRAKTRLTIVHRPPAVDHRNAPTASSISTRGRVRRKPATHADLMANPQQRLPTVFWAGARDVTGTRTSHVPHPLA